jgi:hypothetical protein
MRSATYVVMAPITCKTKAACSEHNADRLTDSAVLLVVWLSPAAKFWLSLLIARHYSLNSHSVFYFPLCELFDEHSRC